MTLHQEHSPLNDSPDFGPIAVPDGSHDNIAPGSPAPEVIQKRVVEEETLALFDLDDAPTAPIDTDAVRALGEQLDAEAAAKAEVGKEDAEAPLTLATIAVATTAEKPAEEKEAADEETTEVAEEAKTEAIDEVATEVDEAKKEADDTAKEDAKKKADDDSDDIELTEAVMEADIVKAKHGLRNKLIGVGLVVLAGLGYRMATAGSDSTPEETRSSGPAATAEAFPSTSASADMSVDLNAGTATVKPSTAAPSEQPTTTTEAPVRPVDGEVLIAPELQKYIVNYAALNSNPEAYLQTYADGLINPAPLSEDQLQEYYTESAASLGFDSNAKTAEQWVQDFVDEKLKENYSAVFNALYVNQGLPLAQQQIMAEAMLKDILRTSSEQDISDFVRIAQEAIANAPQGGHYEAAFRVDATSAATGNDTFKPILIEMEFYDEHGNYVSRVNNPASPSASYSTEFGVVQTLDNTTALSSFLGGIDAAH